MNVAQRLNLSGGLGVFGLVWFGQLISLTGSGLTGFSLGVWYYQQNGSVTQLALFSFFNVVPGVLLSPFAGALVDRWDRRQAMLLSDIGAGCSDLFMVLLLVAGHFGIFQLEPWHLYLPVAVTSAFSAFRWPAYYAATTLLVPKQHYGRASGLIELGPGVSQIIAPVLAGILIVSIGLQGVIMIDMTTFVFSVVTLLMVKFPRAEVTAAGQAGKGSLLHEAVYGWTYVKERPGLLGLLLLAAESNLAMGFVLVLMIPLVLSFTNAATLGAILSIGGLGVLVGGVVMTIWGGPKRRINGIIGFMAISGSILFLGGVRPSVALVAVAAFVFLFFTPIINASAQAIWQVKVPADLQGRVFAVRRIIVFASAPLTRLIVGPLADNFFEPWLATNGPLAGSVGRFIGTGPGRGIGFMFVLLGVIYVVATVLAYLNPRVRNVEHELPDAIEDQPVLVPTKEPGFAQVEALAQESG